MFKFVTYSLFFLQVIRMRKRKRKWSRNLAKHVTGSRNDWEIKLQVCKFQTGLALHLVSWCLENLVGLQTWKGCHLFSLILNDVFWKFECIVQYVIKLTAGWWRHNLWVMHPVWNSWGAEGCLRSTLTILLSGTWMYDKWRIPTSFLCNDYKLKLW